MSSIQPNPIPSVTGAGQPHAPPTDEEAVYYQGSPMLGGKPEEVLGLSLLGIIFLLAPLLVRIFSHTWLPHVVSLILMVIGVALLIAPIVITKSVRYRISNYRIDFERGVISRDITTLELWHVEDIAFHQSILDRILGIGTIRVLSHDESMPDLRMRGLPDARKLFEELKQRIIAVKRQSGVLKLDSGT